jgi:5-carboxymethyl-2-hydroxymuconate isomerase
MPHFIIDCSENIISFKSPKEIIQKVYNAAHATNLFDKDDIKIRINPYKYYRIGNSKKDFIHVFSNIMEGRSNLQKAHLSKSIIKELKFMFPNIPIISINIREFDTVSYCNKSMI